MNDAEMIFFEKIILKSKIASFRSRDGTSDFLYVNFEFF
jgi:hypothetical protein